jgi:sterol desaturase/sphingolipid hydroxylase (fatty acid hydroxylase superfamily)
VAYVAVCVVLLDVLHDAWFYWTHRALHWRPLYRAVHWEHHR